MSRFRPRRRAFLVALPAAAAVALASAGAIGVLQSGGDDALRADREGTQLTESANATVEKAGVDTFGAQTGAASADTQSPPGPTTGRAQQVTANLRIEVADNDALSDATQRALETTRSLGGYVVNVSYSTSADGFAGLTLRVPTAKVQEAITRLSSLGTIVAQQVQIADLQEAIDALDRRMANLRERIARLTAQLDQPGLDEETRATLQARRSAARAELAAARGDRAGHTAAARLATIQLELVTDQEGAGVAPQSRFDRALDEALGILAVEGMAMLFVVILGGPFVLVAVAIWWGRRAIGRRADERLLGSS